MNKTNKVLIHITIWLIVVAVTADNYYLPNWIQFKSIHVFLQALDFIPRILLFYIHYLWLMPVFLLKKKYGSYTLLLTLAIFCNVLVLRYLWNGDVSKIQFY